MFKNKWRKLQCLSFLIILILINSTEQRSFAQDIDRIYFQDTITALSLTDLRHSAFFSIKDSFSIVLSDNIPGRLHFIKLDSNDQVLEARSYTVPGLNNNIGINSSVFHQGYIYFTSPYNGGIYGKLDTELNLIWLKKMIVPLPDQPKPKSICAINNQFFISTSVSSSTLISRFDLNGNPIASKIIIDSSGGGNYQTMVTDDTSLFVIAQQTNYGAPTPIHIYKLSPWLSKSRDVVLLKAGIYYDEIVGFNIIENKQNLRIDFNTGGSGGNSTFFTVKVNKDLRIEDTKKWDASINQQNKSSSQLQTLISGNEFYKIFPFNGVNLGGYIITRSYLGWIEQFKFHSTLGLNNDPHYKYLGVNRNNNKRNFYRHINGGITDTVQTSIIEIVKAPSVPVDFPCDISENMQLREFQGFNIFENFDRYTISNISISSFDLSYTYSVLSTSQSPWCVNNTIDTCAIINARIPNKLDTLCTDLNYTFNSSTYFIDSLQWKINGIAMGNSNTLNFSFDTVGNYTISLEAFPEGNTCFVADSFSVIVEPKPILLSTDTIICSGDSVLLETLNSESNLWTNAQNIQCDSCASTWVTANNLTRIIWTGTNNKNCIIQEQVDIETFPIANGSIIGPKDICPGSDSIIFSINSSFTDSVIWWVDTIGIINTSTIDSITISWPDTVQSANIFALLFDENACQGDTLVYNVNVDAELNPQIVTSSNTFCFFDKDSVNYRILDPINNAQYQWNADTGIIEGFPSYAEVLISWDSVGSHFLISEEIVQTNIANCYGADTVFVQIKESPRTELVIDGPAKLCLNVSDTFTCNTGDPNSTYVWSSNDGYLIEGYLTPSIIYVWFEDSMQVLSVVERATNGCRGKETEFEVFIPPKPQPIAEFDSSVICISDTLNQSYSMIGFDSSSYSWSISNGEIIAGQGTDEITVNWNTRDYKRFKIVENSLAGCPSDTLEAVLFGDFSYPEIDYLDLEDDTCIRFYYEINKFWTNPNLYFKVMRREVEPIETDWKQIGLALAYLDSYIDRDVDKNNNRYEYSIYLDNQCKAKNQAPYHNNILLKSEVVSESNSDEIRLNWNPYVNWKNGLDQYEVYETNESGALNFLARVNTTHYTLEKTDAFINYCFKVRALNEDPEMTSWSNTTCILKESEISIPNVITPNGDGYNDLLVISNINSFSNHELIIYNRSGRPIYKSTNYSNDWPKEEIISGTYFYSLKINNPSSGKSNLFKGWLEILR
ncbi:MAG: gliding motility-associated C-terminal domain-containing protein [Cytophagales bacterium]